LAKQPRFSWDTTRLFVNNKGFVAPVHGEWLLGLLGSRIMWFLIARICLGLGERAGMYRYQLFEQFIAHLTIPKISKEEQKAMGNSAMKLSEEASTRYKLHAKTRHRILSDFNTSGESLNQKLVTWWNLDFPAFRAEVKKVFKKDIQLAERDEWDEWLAERRAKHLQLTAEIVRIETELNARVYALFDLTTEEINIIEEDTKYRYGEV
jgi:hypothetical protein